MTNALALAVDYLRRSRMRVRAIEALIEAGDHPDAVRESQETVGLAIKSLLKLVDYEVGDAEKALEGFLEVIDLVGRAFERNGTSA